MPGPAQMSSIREDAVSFVVGIFGRQLMIVGALDYYTYVHDHWNKKRENKERNKKRASDITHVRDSDNLLI